MKIAAGETIVCNKIDGVIGAVIKYNNKNCAITAYHILEAGKCNLSDIVHLNSYKGRIIEIFWNYDLAIIEIIAPESEIKFSEIDQPKIGPAYSLNHTKRINCRVMTVGKTFHYLAFPFNPLPLPGDSGSPIIQNEKVVGILASIFYNNATAIALSIERFIVHSKKINNNQEL
jgi:hypothetical protein